jgi:hypothetical protein
MRIPNIFYVGLLSKVKRNKQQAWENRPPPITVDGEEECKVEGIMDCKEEKGKWFYLIKWKGYGPKESTWEPKGTQGKPKECGKTSQKVKGNFEKEVPQHRQGPLKGGQCCRHHSNALNFLIVTVFFPSQ